MAVQEIVRRHGLRVGVVPSGGRLNFGRWLTSVGDFRRNPLLAALAPACGGGLPTSNGTTAPPSIAGSWSVELNQNGTTQSLFQTTLVSQAVASSACSFAALLGSCSRITIMANDSQETPEFKKVHCNECRRETEHRLLMIVQGDSGETVELDELDEHECTIRWATTFDLLQCCGCRETVLRRTFIFSPHDDRPDVRYFPPRVSRHLPNLLTLLTLRFFQCPTTRRNGCAIKAKGTTEFPLLSP